MRVRLSVFLLAIVLCAATLASAAERPPRNLHLVGDHWTAWNPPTPPAGAQVYVIQRGDTLWDLARKNYGDPYLWPQIWEKNQYILDAHWIYPGDPLEIVPKVTSSTTLATIEPGGEPKAGAGGETTASGTEEEETPEPGGNTPIKEATMSEPVPLAAETDIACTGYVGDLDEAFPFRVVGSEAETLNVDQAIYHSTEDRRTPGDYGPHSTTKFGLATGDIVYLDGGRAKGMAAGAQYSAVIGMEDVVHPATGKIVGRYYHYLGRIRVLSVQETTAIAEIVETCDPVVVGSLLKPYEPEPVPLGRTSPIRPVNYPAEAEKLKEAPVILYAQHDLVALGADHVVQIDRGSEDDVTPGDFFTIYRQNREGMPPVILGELAVLSVHKHTSVAKIIESRYSIHLGDRLQAK
jgi:hypothetical protein